MPLMPAGIMGEVEAVYTLAGPLAMTGMSASNGLMGEWFSSQVR
jgi:hypothetical protein